MELFTLNGNNEFAFCKLKAIVDLIIKLKRNKRYQESSIVIFACREVEVLNDKEIKVLTPHHSLWTGVFSKLELDGVMVLLQH